MAYIDPIYNGIRMLQAAGKEAKRPDVVVVHEGGMLIVRGVNFDDLSTAERKRMDNMGWIFKGVSSTAEDGAPVTTPTWNRHL